MSRFPLFFAAMVITCVAVADSLTHLSLVIPALLGGDPVQTSRTITDDEGLAKFLKFHTDVLKRHDHWVQTKATSDKHLSVWREKVKDFFSGGVTSTMAVQCYLKSERDGVPTYKHLHKAYVYKGENGFELRNQFGDDLWLKENMFAGFCGPEIKAILAEQVNKAHHEGRIRTVSTRDGEFCSRVEVSVFPTADEQSEETHVGFRLTASYAGHYTSREDVICE